MSRAAVQSGAWVLAAAIGALTSHGPSGSAEAAQQKSRRPVASQPSAPQFDRYQVAAGTALLLKVSTPQNSSTAVIDDQVEAVPWSPVVQDGIELVLAGSVVFGKVTGRKRRLDPVDVAIPAGTRFVAMTAEPLIVRIPR